MTDPGDDQPRHWTLLEFFAEVSATQRLAALPWYAKPAPGEEKGFAVHVAKADLLKAMTRPIKC